jgi:hypothetical protein
MATIKEVFALLLTADGKAAVAEMGRLGDSAEKDLGRGGKAAGDFNKQIIALGAGIATAGAATIAVLKSTSDAYVQNGREVIKLQRSTGATAEEASRLRFAAQQSGIGVDQLSAAVVRLSKSSGTSGGAKALQTLGVSLKDAYGQSRPVVDVLTDIAEQVSKLDNGDQKNNLVTTLFGKGGAQLLPLLNRGAEGIGALADQADRLGLTFSEQDVANVKELAKAQKDLAAARAGLANQIGREVTPYLTQAETAVAGVATAAVEKLQKVPEGLKQVLAQIAVVGGGGATILGGVATGAAALNETVGAAGILKAHFRDANGNISNMTKGLGGAAVATVAWGYAIGENNRQFEESIDLMTRIGELQQLQAAFDPKNPKNLTLTSFEIANTLAGKNEIGPSSGLDKVKDYVGLYSDDDETDNRIAATTALLDKLKISLVALDATSGRKLLDEVSLAMKDIGVAGPEIEQTLRPLYDLIGNQEAVARGEDAMNGYAGGIENVGDSAERAKAKLAGFGTSLDQMLDLADANDRLAAAQKKQAETLTSNSPAVISAYDQLTKAQQRLQDVMKADDGLSQISPEEEIRRARARLADANARLAASPRDAGAITDKDEALADIERASKRRQELKRTAEERAAATSSAQSDLASAQKAYDDAVANTGVGSEAYAAAGREIVRAQQDIEAGTKALVDQMIAGNVPIDQIRAKLKEWEDQGILTHDAVKNLNDQLNEQIRLALILAALNQSEFVVDGIDKEHLAGRPLTGTGTGGTSTKPVIPGTVDNPGFTPGQIWGPGGAPGYQGMPFVSGTRASGGSALAGNLYRVNEYGRGRTEYFQPGIDGKVLPVPLGEQPQRAPMVMRPPGPAIAAGATQATSAAPTEHHEHLHLHEVLTPAAAIDVSVRERRSKAYLMGTGSTSPRSG